MHSLREPRHRDTRQGMHWASIANIPSQAGKTYVVTGANSGLGFETARALAQKGAHVVLACRSQQKGRAALEKIRSETPTALQTLVALDLASLASIRSCSAELLTLAPTLNGLVNNAGLMALPMTRTEDGFEMQIGTNHLGHFALTSFLLPALEAARGRVVTVSSIMHMVGTVVPDDLSFERRPYDKWKAYGQSKLANLLFTYELERRLRSANKHTIALAAHPGYSATELAYKGPDAEGSRFMHAMMRFGSMFAQSQERGALPQLRALTDPEAQGGEYYGPKGFLEGRGDAGRVDSNAASKDVTVARALWAQSVALTGESFSGI
jgi:NAD(P)-dependent dehydrogenase (short-subunit alcohol dehydrogenase family)